MTRRRVHSPSPSRSRRNVDIFIPAAAALLLHVHLPVREALVEAYTCSDGYNYRCNGITSTDRCDRFPETAGACSLYTHKHDTDVAGSMYKGSDQRFDSVLIQTGCNIIGRDTYQDATIDWYLDVVYSSTPLVFKK